MKIKTKRLVAVIASFVILALFVLGAFVPLLSRSLSSADEIDEPQRDPVPNPGSNSYRPWTIWGNSSSSTFGQTSWLWPDTARNVSLLSTTVFLDDESVGEDHMTISADNLSQGIISWNFSGKLFGGNSTFPHLCIFTSPSSNVLFGVLLSTSKSSRYSPWGTWNYLSSSSFPSSGSDYDVSTSTKLSIQFKPAEGVVEGSTVHFSLWASLQANQIANLLQPSISTFAGGYLFDGSGIVRMLGSTASVVIDLADAFTTSNFYQNFQDFYLPVSSKWSLKGTSSSLAIFGFSTTFYADFLLTDDNKPAVAGFDGLDPMYYSPESKYDPSSPEPGYDEGYEAGYNDGYDEGYESGMEKGHDFGYEEGFAAGTEQGYKEGYSAGLNKGHSDNITNPLAVALDPVETFMTMPIFGNVTIGQFFNVVLFVLIASIFIKMFAGG